MLTKMKTKYLGSILLTSQLAPVHCVMLEPNCKINVNLQCIQIHMYITYNTIIYKLTYREVINTNMKSIATIKAVHVATN